ncbi:MAG: hypothetical protein HZA07_02510 [Nitrospirae bacterium]|nr:hypothetical protein [Nitrospirota bacterium]
MITVSKPSTDVIVLGKDSSGRIAVAFPYDPLRVEKVRTIEGRKWHPFPLVIARSPERSEGTPKQSQDRLGTGSAILKKVLIVSSCKDMIKLLQYGQDKKSFGQFRPERRG